MADSDRRQHDNAEDISQIRVLVERLSGQLSTLDARVQGQGNEFTVRLEAGTRESQQLFQLVTDQLSHVVTQTADLQKAQASQQKEITDLKMWRAKLSGVAMISAGAGAVVSSVITAFVLKAVGVG